MPMRRARHHRKPNPVLSVSPGAIDRAERLAVEAVQEGARRAIARDHVHATVANSGDDEAAVWSAAKSIGLDNARAEQHGIGIFPDARNSATCIGRPNAFLVEPHTLRPRQTPAELPKICCDQFEI